MVCDFPISSNSQSSGADSNFFQIGSAGFYVRGWLSVQGHRIHQNIPQAHLIFPALTHWPGRELLVEAFKHFFLKFLFSLAFLLVNDFLLTTAGMMDQEGFSVEKRKNFTFSWGLVCSRGSHSSRIEVARAHQKALLFGVLWQCPVEKAMAPHASTLAWKIPWTEEPGRLQSMGSLRVGHDWATSFSLFTFMHWRRKWQPTPVFLPGESQGRGSLVGCRLWGRTESDTTEVT